MFLFSDDSEFITCDNRKDNTWHPISSNYYNVLNSITLQPDLCEGKDILDLGSCIGATGKWCIENGANSYTGVELQKEYHDIASRLLNGYDNVNLFNCDLVDFLENNTTKFDLVVCSGVIYSFVDYYRILKLLVKNSSKYIIINYAKCENGVVYRDLPINSSGGGSYVSIGPTFSVDTMARLMHTLGCETFIKVFDINLNNYRYRTKGRAVSMFKVTDDIYIDNQIKLKNKPPVDKEWK